MHSIFRWAVFLLLLLCRLPLINASVDTLNNNYRFYVGFGLGSGINSGGFKGFQNIETCCAIYPDIQGSLYKAAFGFEKRYQSILSGGFYGTRIGLSSLNAPFLQREFVGNVIFNNGVEKATIDFSLNAQVMYLAIEPFIAFNIPATPTFLLAGISIASPISSSFLQKETLISPSNVTFRNGTTTQNEISDNIPNLNKVQISPIIGLGAEFILSDAISLKPSIQFRPQLLQIVDGLPWNNQSFLAELGVVYTFIPKEKVLETPPPAIIEQAPIVEEKKEELPVLTMHFHALMNEGMLEFGDTVDYPYTRNIQRVSSTKNPVFIFDDNSSEIISNASVSLNELKSYLSVNPAIPLQLFSHANDQEDKDIANARAVFIKKQLQEAGINNPIKISTHIVPASSLRYTELLPETRKVLLSYSDGSLPTLVQSDTTYSFVNTDIRFLTEPSIIGARIAGLITLEKSKTATIEESDKTFSLAPDIAHPLIVQKLIAQSYVDMPDGMKAKSRIELYIRPTLHKEITVENQTEDEGEEHILGYCDFDEEQLYAINMHAIERIAEAQKQGHTITLIPLTDDLGKGEHNKVLADKRLKAALKVIGIHNSSIDVSKIVKADARILSKNSSMLDRMMHRGILVRIEHR